MGNLEEGEGEQEEGGGEGSEKMNAEKVVEMRDRDKGLLVVVVVVVDEEDDAEQKANLLHIGYLELSLV